MRKARLMGTVLVTVEVRALSKELSCMEYLMVSFLSRDLTPHSLSTRCVTAIVTVKKHSVTLAGVFGTRHGQLATLGRVTTRRLQLPRERLSTTRMAQ